MCQSNQMAVMRLRDRLSAATIIAAAAVTNGCDNVSRYVDGRLRDMEPPQVRRVTYPRAVQLLVSFQTNGTANTWAKEVWRPRVLTLLEQSGVFCAISDTPVDGGAVLDITINNRWKTEDAYHKAVFAGVSLGVLGTALTDGYVCTIAYQPASGAAPVTKEVRHALHTMMGDGPVPPHTRPSPSFAHAADTIVRQLVVNGLDALVTDPGFGA
jgi:hypothetical protein